MEKSLKMQGIEIRKDLMKFKSYLLESRIKSYFSYGLYYKNEKELKREILSFSINGKLIK